MEAGLSHVALLGPVVDWSGSQARTGLVNVIQKKLGFLIRLTKGLIYGLQELEGRRDCPSRAAGQSHWELTFACGPVAVIQCMHLHRG